MATYIIFGVLVILIALAFIKIKKNKKKGGCSGCCSGCSESCSQRTNEDK